MTTPQEGMTISLGPVKVALEDKRTNIFMNGKNLIKDLGRKGIFWIILVGPKCNQVRSYKRETKKKILDRR